MLTHKHRSIRLSNLSLCKQQMRGTPVTSACEQFVYLHYNLIYFMQFLRIVCDDPVLYLTIHLIFLLCPTGGHTQSEHFCLYTEASVQRVKLLPLFVLLGRLDTSSLLTSDQKQHKKHIHSYMFSLLAVPMQCDHRPQSYNLQREKQGVFYTIIVTTAVVC